MYGRVGEKLGGEDPKSWAKIGINILDHKLCFKLHGVPTQPSIHHENKETNSDSKL